LWAGTPSNSRQLTGVLVGLAIGGFVGPQAQGQAARSGHQNISVQIKRHNPQREPVGKPERRQCLDERFGLRVDEKEVADSVARGNGAALMLPLTNTRNWPTV